MAALPIEGAGVAITSDEGFSRFYRANLPAVYGYALRLCAGDRGLAEDLTQDTWFALVKELARNRTDCADIRWLLAVTRSRFIDRARRERRGAAKLALLRQPKEGADLAPTPDEVLSLLGELQPIHRAVLIMRYVDGLSVPAIAAEIGRDVTATNSLLARARFELRHRRAVSPDA